MDTYKEPNVTSWSKKPRSISGYSIASFFLSASPLAIVLMGFLFYLLVSGGSTSENDMGAVWWFFIFLIWIIVPIALIANILSIIFGIKGLKIKKTIFAWAGIAIVILEILTPIAVIGTIVVPATIARNQEISQLQKEIKNYETYADLTAFGLGIYKLKDTGDRHLWDITKPEKIVINYDGVDMVFDVHYNRKDDTTWDNAWGSSNEGIDVTCDVILYQGTYIIIPPLWEQHGVLYYWGYIYLCKDINENADLFDIGILDKNVVNKLLQLPGEKMSRKELSEKLGKTF